MLQIDIPGGDSLRIEHVVLDYNGTMAVGGVIIKGVIERLRTLSDRVKIHIVTADTFGSVRDQIKEEDFEISILRPVDQEIRKRDYVWLLGSDAAVAIGNGRNDALMLEEAALAFGIVEAEGFNVSVLQNTDIVFTGILDALDALIDPQRLTATLRR